MDKNKVSVNIYGKDYTVSGDRPSEEIIRIASHVDLRMKELADGGFRGPVSEMAVLAAITVAEELYEYVDENESLKKDKAEMNASARHYEQLWDEAKKSFLVYKEDSQMEVTALNAQIEDLRDKLSDREKEIGNILSTREKFESDTKRDSHEAVMEARKKYKEMESNYFDLQMENTQLKSEVEKLNNDLKWERNDKKGYKST